MDSFSDPTDSGDTGRVADPDRIAALYATLQPQLWRIVARNLSVDEALLEDACQTAWSRFLDHGAELAAGTELGWLSTTATRAALRLLRAQRLTEPLPIEGRPDGNGAGVPDDPERALELSERLAEIRELPPRQRRAVWLQGLGYEYAEIAAATGDSCRTVERHLTRARQRLLHLAGEE